MEVSLLAALTSAMALLALRLRRTPEDRRALGLLAAAIAAAVLVRTDAVLVAAVTIVAVARWAPRGPARRRIATATLGTLVGFLGAQTVFRVVYYGNALPNTYYLKVAGTPLGTRVDRGFDSLVALGASGLAVLVALAAVGWFAARRRGRGAAAGLLVALFGAMYAYSAYVGGDAWEWFLFANRYVSCGLPVCCVLAGCGIVGVLDAGPRARRWTATMTALALVVLLGVAARGALPTADLQYSLPHTRELAERTVSFLVAIALAAAALWGHARARPWRRPARSRRGS